MQKSHNDDLVNNSGHTKPWWFSQPNYVKIMMKVTSARYTNITVKDETYPKFASIWNGGCVVNMLL
jgi:hypothetical protein